MSLHRFMVDQLTQSQFENSPSQDHLKSYLRIRHTCTHVLAMAVQTLFPETKVTIGPTTETGFYYDFDRFETFTLNDLSRIEAQMRQLIKANLPIIREVKDWSRA